MLDGAHSKTSAKNLYDYLKGTKLPLYCVWAMQRNKFPKEFLKEFTSKKAMSNRGYLAQIGLVPLASDKYQSTRTAALELITINLN